MRAGVIVIRVHLYREFLGRKEELNEQRKTFDALEPDLTDLLVRIVEEGLQTSGAPHLFQKTRSETPGAHQTRAAMNLWRRSRPRSISCIEVAYEIRT